MTKARIAKAFSNADFEICFEYLIEETTWNIPGERYLKGRPEIEKFCQEIKSYFNSITTNFKPINIIENEHCVAINGTAEFICDRKRVNYISSCDVYVFDSNNKIISITSYCISEK